MGFKQPSAKLSQGAVDSWWRQGMIGSAKALYDGIKAFSKTDQTEDLKAINVPTMVFGGVWIFVRESVADCKRASAG